MTRLPAKTFRDLVVWQKAHAWVLEAYAYSRGFPKAELYGLTSQLRPAAVSVPANIVEAFRKRSHAEKRYFLNVAQCSLEECRYYLILAQDLGYGDSRRLSHDLEEVSRLLEAFSSKISGADG
ncbi:MAG: four helix bundle protein [Phycisphaerae bacterium]|nr:four helix bundle protein [Phycisphaerae bacterium]